MSKSKAALLCAVILLLLGAKLLLPEQSAKLIREAGNFLGGADYAGVFSRLGEAIYAFDEDEEADAELIRDGEKLGETARLTEAALSTGERYEPENGHQDAIPAAVEAFLESQKAYADYELPDTVSYEYEPFPGETAVPVAGYNSSGFGYRLHPIHGDVRFHYGSDFAAWSGEEILCFADGVVSFAGYCDSYGNYLKVDHGDGWQSLYAHCSCLYVNEGDRVERGSCIALVGDSGMVTGPHLHFELTHGGIYVNPEYYVNQ